MPQHSSDKSTEPLLYCVPALFGRVGMLGATGRDRDSKQVCEATLIDVKGASCHAFPLLWQLHISEQRLVSGIRV